MPMQPDKRLAFFQGFLREPQQVASVIPSSRFLERRLVNISGARQASTVVELGPGTGGTTRALLRALPSSSRLLAIEIDPHFASLLREEVRDPRLTVECASAADIGPLLARHRLPAPESVVSGIPFSTMPMRIGQAILRAVRGSLASGGRFVAYQFRDRVAVLGREILGEPEVDVELLNVPPMRVYCWRKARG
ncbi:MAG: methyltransferase type 12 [Gammaproteobacteria bacterium]|nr:methyltransferase type 12 [Gammaproteobacteria bacterium]QOJ32448.1 MAG: methyltransferase type 12 [Gammaproteobacteria bacterium]CAG0933781.1 phosphatidylethanolamine/phosphatidyl-N-methylethanolamine N-methyltransferase [Rhodocyclaceae bacterium]